MADEHEGFGTVLRSLHPRDEPRPTVGLAARALLDGGDREPLRQALDAGPLTGGGLLSLTGDAPWFERSLTLPPGLWTALRGGSDQQAGLPYLDDLPAPSTAGLEGWLVRPDCQRALRALAARARCTVVVSGDEAEPALWRAASLTAAAGLTPLALDWPAAEDPALERRTAAFAVAQDGVPVARLPEPGSEIVHAPAFRTAPGPVVIACRAGAARIASDRPILHVAAERLSLEDRRRVWSQALPGRQGEADALAGRFPIEPAVALGVAADARLIEAIEDRPVQLAELAESIRTRSGMRLGGGVRLIRPQAGWEHLVVPDDVESQLREAADRLRCHAKVLDDWGFLANRRGSRGVKMLLSGPPGTGKTLAAEVVARSLDADLLFVDLSRVVSKWIGETEKNLSAVFDAAERAQAVLLFDEADALFGRRTEVSDAHDRYANLETAYLLARLERFEGLAILSTNFKQNIDSAFLRRLEYALELREPDERQRLRLWEAHIPRRDELLAPDARLEELAALYPLVGGMIRNAALSAAYLAAREDGLIRRAHLLRAIRREYHKSGRAFPGAPPEDALNPGDPK